LVVIIIMSPITTTKNNSSTADGILEMSVEETNALRARLGLPPLKRVGATSDVAATDSRGGTTATAKKKKTKGEEEEEEKVVVVLEMSVEETNRVRASLGLPPLRNNTTTTTSSSATATSTNNIIHAPPPSPIREDLEALRKQVQQNALDIFGNTTLADDHQVLEHPSASTSWAQAMRQTQTTAGSSYNKIIGSDTSPTIHNASITTTKKKKKKHHDESDLKGVQVQHDISELWTHNHIDDDEYDQRPRPPTQNPVILTLTDAPILQVSHDHAQKVLGLNEEMTALENTELVQQQKTAEGLRAKRKYERANDAAVPWEQDEEYELLGPSSATGKDASSASWIPPMKKKKKSKGFRIGEEDYYKEQEQPPPEGTGALVFSKTNKISLEEKGGTVATDYMTVEEAEEQYGKPKFKKQKDKNRKKKKQGRIRLSDPDDENEGKYDKAFNKDASIITTKSLLQELEENAALVEIAPKRRRDNGDEENKEKAVTSEPLDDNGYEKNRIQEQRLKYESIMAKGNERSMLAFAPKRQTTDTTTAFDEEEPDDAFLNAALAKSRRLQQLQNMEKKKRGAQAVVAAVRQPTPETIPSSSNNTITFSIDETREFTIALRAKTEQAEREYRREKELSKVGDSEISKTQTTTVKEEETTTEVKQESGEDDMKPEEDINELAKQVREDNVGLEGTGSSAPLGRGLGSILGLLKQTGELTRKNAGKEEMRGRAKDKRTYEDYEPLNLSEVVRIDEKAATDKDRELAHREVKLEYRDNYGRLLTRKEAFRELSYQFHGYGSGKRKEEKKQQQIAREQAEARLASRQAAEAGIFGAVKKTQKATGKAFIVHKTGT
jgi:U4/U6.U5 tri-snRNP-associated protein 1